jgi:uncharacterized protein (TIGR00251 family)
MTSTPWLTEHPDGVVITIRATPRAKHTEVVGVVEAALRVRVQAPPVDGKANKVLSKFLAKHLGVPNSAISIVGGQTARNKRVHIAGVNASHVYAALQLESQHS